MRVVKSVYTKANKRIIEQSEMMVPIMFVLVSRELNWRNIF